MSSRLLDECSYDEGDASYDEDGGATTMDSANAAVAALPAEGSTPHFKSRPPPVEEAAYCAAAAGLPVPNTMTFAPIGVRL